MAEQVSKSQFKDKALELFRQIESSGKAVFVTDHGKPTFRRPLTTHCGRSRVGEALTALAPTAAVQRMNSGAGRWRSQWTVGWNELLCHITQYEANGLASLRMRRNLWDKTK